MLTFRNGFKDRNSVFNVITGTIFAIFCVILVKIASLIPKISQGVSVSFGTRCQKSTYHTKYLSKYWSELHPPFSISRLMYAFPSAAVYRAILHNLLLTPTHSVLVDCRRRHAINLANKLSLSHTAFRTNAEH